MTDQGQTQRPSATIAARRVDQRTDTALKLLAVRALSTEFVKRVAEITLGKTVTNVEEIVLRNAVDSQVDQYLLSKQDGSDGRTYLGMTAAFDTVQERTAELSQPQGNQQTQP